MSWMHLASKTNIGSALTLNSLSVNANAVSAVRGILMLEVYLLHALHCDGRKATLDSNYET